MAPKISIKFSTGNPALVDRVEEGLPVQDVVVFGRTAGFTNEELATLIQIPMRTYARRVAGKSRLKIDEGERAVRLIAFTTAPSRSSARMKTPGRWLNRPLRVLGGRTPLDFGRTEPGAREVEGGAGAA